MRAKFIHDAVDGVCHAFDTAFPQGKWVNVDHLSAEHQNTLAANPTFETSGEPDPPSPNGEGQAAPAARVGNGAAGR